MRQNSLVRINFPGGIIAPGYLLEILEIISKVNVGRLRFGSRQQLLVEIPNQQLSLFALLCAESHIIFYTQEQKAGNIVSSYAAAGIFIHDSWLSEGVCKDVFDLFDYAPQLKVNISDGNQTFVPLFTGNINWIASSHLHFWFLYVRFPGSNRLLRWPHLVYTNDLCLVSQVIESLVINYPGRFDEGEIELDILVGLVEKKLRYISKPIENDLRLPRFHLPYYEGFNPQGDKWWLGIYRRDEYFSVDFLKDLCALCLQTRVGELHATTWKSIIIKGIEKIHRVYWDQVLGKHRINVRHAANELNWLIEDDCEDGLILKRHIIRYFDKEDVRTYGLCFAVKIRSTSGMFGSVIIRRKEIKNPGRLKYLERYSIFYTDRFNPNSGEFILFRDDVQKEHLGPYLVALCKQFYGQQDLAEVISIPQFRQLSSNPVKHIRLVHQCPDCLTVYDPEAGDDAGNVTAGTPFNDLPDEYGCAVCGSPKSSFKQVEEIDGLLQVL